MIIVTFSPKIDRIIFAVEQTVSHCPINPLAGIYSGKHCVCSTVVSAVLKHRVKVRKCMPELRVGMPPIFPQQELGIALLRTLGYLVHWKRACPALPLQPDED